MAEFKPVKLRSPEGAEHTAHNPVELNDLVYGQGYTVVGRGKTIEDVAPSADEKADKK
ncbi:hypothetical protein [Pseudonocardia alni]|uniref:hypothetical protein n=1 Tax=Pseudonocardia alni TaxID=33907 RepID=UPI00332A00E8